MFEDFANVWTPVALARSLSTTAPLAVTVAGTKVVLFRDGAGRAKALIDQCPHRGVALSLGKVNDGCIECPFHGWRIEGGGGVTHVPWNPDAKLETLRAKAVPVCELGGQVWIHTSVGLPPTKGPEVHEAISRDGVRVSGFDVVWNTHWTRAMENMLDWPHLPFVHKATIGKSMVRASGSRLDVEWEPRAWGAHTSIRIDGKDQPGSLDFRWPNQMNLHIPIPGKLLMMLVACVPIDATHTRMMMVMARDFLTLPIFDFVFHRMNARIANEDRAIVESSVPMEVPAASEEKSVRTDGPTLQFRKRYFADLRGSSVRSETQKGDRHLPMAPPEASA